MKGVSRILIAGLCLVAAAAQGQVVAECPDPNGDPNYCDSDQDGWDDNSDNCTLVPNAGQRDTDGDFFGNRCDADFNNDGVTNFDDLAIMKVNFFAAGDSDTDLDGDGTTNFDDLAIMKALFFSQPGPTGVDPLQPPCNCYFSGDCDNGFCDYGPGSFTVEDICVWRGVKPEGVAGWGCSFEVNAGTGNWPPGICDGVCTPPSAGSYIGLEDRLSIAQTISLWGQAMIEPSAAGGGPVDAQLANAASTVQFQAQGVPLMLGRHAADALAMAAGAPFHNYFCHYEGHPKDANPPVVDLAGDSCRIQAGYLTIEALASEIRTPGTAAGIMRGIMDVCPGWQEMFATQCEPGRGALKCAVNFIEAQAYFLRTPRIQPFNFVNRILGSQPET